MNRAVVAALLSVLLVSACNGNGNGSGGKASPSTATTTATPTKAATPTPTKAATAAATKTAAAKPKSLSTAGRKCTKLEETLRLFPGHDLSIANRGSHLKEVQELQSMVNGAGDGSKCIPEDGDFGPMTKQAVIAFQKKSGLVVDGLVGEQTWNQLNLVLSH